MLVLWRRLDQKHVVPREAVVPTDGLFALGTWEATEDYVRDNQVQELPASSSRQPSVPVPEL